MSVTPTYPGIYIEELPSSSHSVTAAPTAVTVFVGYTNPFWLVGQAAPPFRQAVALSSFAAYTANFGGLFSCPWLPDLVGQAVFQFYLNGGSDAYVVALPTSAVAAPTVTLESGSVGFKLTALQPTGYAASGTSAQVGQVMTLFVTNPSTTGGTTDDTADIRIAYGSTLETFRGVKITDIPSRINGHSQLASAALVGSPTTYDSLTTGTTGAPFVYASRPASSLSVFTSGDFAAVFQAGSALDKLHAFNLLALPGITNGLPGFTNSTVLAEALSFCEQKRAFFLMDPPANTVADSLAGNLPGAPASPQPITSFQPPATSQNGALYFPYLQTADPLTGSPSTSPPSGFVAGIFAREDANRGVWKSPAGLETTIKGSTGVVPWGAVTDVQQGQVNAAGVNCLRTFPGIGSVVFGARTLVSGNPSFQQWWYVAVRRMALFIEQSLYESLKWAVFEPNDEALWAALTQEVAAFMLGLFRQGAFAGTTAESAFQVQCDSTTTTQTDVDSGRVNLLVGFAPLKPAEFVVVQITQIAGQAQ